jgi:TolB-like protein
MYMMKKANLGFCLTIGFVLSCVGTLHAQQSRTLSLDEVITQSAKTVEARVSTGAKLAVLNFASTSESFSDYVIEELTGALVMNNKVTVIERRSLDLIRKEMNLQLSGDVSDDSAQAIGKQLGAQSIVSGSLTNLGNMYRFRIKVINVETARIETQASYNMGNDEQVTFLLHGNQQSVPTVATRTPAAPAPAPAATVPAPAPAATVPVPAPAATVPTPAPAAPSSAASSGQTQPGLYVGRAYQGRMDLYDALDWITINAQSGGVYSIVLGSDQKVLDIALDYGGKAVTVSLKAAGGERKITYETTNPSYPLFTVKAGTTFTLEEGVVLSGVQSARVSLVYVDGGTFIMNGGAIRDNKKSGGTSGGGVYVNTGSFIMNNGTISGNTSSSHGGGVYVNGGSFTMNGGTISGNTASNNGGGVFVASRGTFIKSGRGGVISGSNAPTGQPNKAGYDSYGHAVFVESGGKKRSTTARVATAMDSTKSGTSWGWE